MLLPGMAVHTPMANGMTNAALMAPVTTSPASKPMPTNILGTKKVRARDARHDDPRKDRRQQVCG